MRYLKKDYFKERLIDLRNRLKLIDGTIMSSDKHLISLIFRGFSNSQINDLVREQFKYFDMPNYWKRHKSLRLNDEYAKYYEPKYKKILMENING